MIGETRNTEEGEQNLSFVFSSSHIALNLKNNTNNNEAQDRCRSFILGFISVEYIMIDQVQQVK